MHTFLDSSLDFASDVYFVASSRSVEKSETVRSKIRGKYLRMLQI